MLRALLWFAFVFDAAALKAGVLSKALKRKDGRPLVVHIWDPNRPNWNRLQLTMCRKLVAKLARLPYLPIRLLLALWQKRNRKRNGAISLALYR